MSTALVRTSNVDDRLMASSVVGDISLATQSPFNHFPTELLLLVFSFIIPLDHDLHQADDESYARAYYTNVKVLRLVCRRWDTVLQLEGYVWGLIPRSAPIPVVAWLLSKSRSAPLTILDDMPFTSSSPSFNSMVLSHVGRWRLASLAFNCQQGSGIAAGLQLDGGPRQLKQLHLACCCGEGEFAINQLLTGDPPPQLTTLVVRGVLPSWEVWRHVKHARIEFWEGTITAQDFLRVINGSQLESLNLCISAGLSGPIDPIIAPKLKSLELQLSGAQSGMVAARFRLPACQHLNVCLSGPLQPYSDNGLSDIETRARELLSSQSGIYLHIRTGDSGSDVLITESKKALLYGPVVAIQVPDIDEPGVSTWVVSMVQRSNVRRILVEGLYDDDEDWSWLSTLPNIVSMEVFASSTANPCPLVNALGLEEPPSSFPFPNLQELVFSFYIKPSSTTLAALKSLLARFPVTTETSPSQHRFQLLACLPTSRSTPSEHDDEIPAILEQLRLRFGAAQVELRLPRSV